MEIYNALILFLLFCSILSINKQFASYLLSVIFVVLVYIAASKDLGVGTDTINYYSSFMNVEAEKNFFVYGGTQKGWYYINLFFREYLNYDLFLYFCYTIIIGGVCFYVYKCSKLPVFSMLLFFLLYFYCSSLNIMRQYIALSILLLGISYMKRSRYVYIFFVLVATLFHSTALFGLSFMFVDCMKIEMKKVIVTLIVLTFVLGIFFADMLNTTLYFMQTLLGGGFRYFAYMDAYGGERNILTNLGINIFFLITYILARNRNELPLKMYFLFIILNNLFGAAGQGNRLFLYFQIAMIVCLPNLYYSLSNRILKYGYLFAILIYSFGIWNYSISANASEVFPYFFR